MRSGWKAAVLCRGKTMCSCSWTGWGLHFVNRLWTSAFSAMSQLSSSQWTELLLLLPASVSLSCRSIVAGRVLMQWEWTKAVQICGLKIACYLSCASVGVCSHCSFRVSIYQLKEAETLSLLVDYCSERSTFIFFSINVGAGWLQESSPCCSDFM